MYNFGKDQKFSALKITPALRALALLAVGTASTIPAIAKGDMPIPLPSPGIQSSIQTQQEPFSKQLRKALEQFHDIVGNTQFQHRISDGTLTKEQYIFHLKQRFLVHQALDTALGSDEAQKNPSIAALYGKEQKEAFKHLQDDLKVLGNDASKLTDKIATKSTKTALEYIRKMGAENPVALLGYLHSLTAGLPFGGQTIGAGIQDAFKASSSKVPTSYYMNSLSVEYYMQKHAPGLNAITDPKTQEEVIKGAKQGYVQIIQTGNDPFYMPKK